MPNDVVTISRVNIRKASTIKMLKKLSASLPRMLKASKKASKNSSTVWPNMTPQWSNLTIYFQGKLHFWIKGLWTKTVHYPSLLKALVRSNRASSPMSANTVRAVVQAWNRQSWHRILQYILSNAVNISPLLQKKLKWPKVPMFELMFISTVSCICMWINFRAS